MEGSIFNSMFFVGLRSSMSFVLVFFIEFYKVYRDFILRSGYFFWGRVGYLVFLGFI